MTKYAPDTEKGSEMPNMHLKGYESYPSLPKKYPEHGTHGEMFHVCNTPNMSYYRYLYPLEGALFFSFFTDDALIFRIFVTN